jgi:hypothetical protein
MANGAVTTFDLHPDAGGHGGPRLRRCNETMPMTMPIPDDDDRRSDA